MRTLYIDCKAGISADMLLKALVDMKVDHLIKPLDPIEDSLCEQGHQDHFTEEQQEHHGHDHDHDNCSLDQAGHSHRTYRDVVEIINDAPISERAKDHAKKYMKL